MAPDGAREEIHFDAYAPREMAERVRDVGVRKVKLDLPSMLALSAVGVPRDLIPVTLGNVVGGAGLVGGMYWFVYLRPGSRP